MVTLASASVTTGEELPGFERSRHFDEQVRTYTFESGIAVHINAPASAAFDSSKPTRLVLYALPNGNTTAQTIGKQRQPDVDWHFFIQHIGAQTRRLREVVKAENLVVAYLEADTRSWPTWRQKHPDSGPLIERLIESVRAHFKNSSTTVELAAHSGGGSLIFGFLNQVDEIPEYVRRIIFLDANYSYSDEQRHGDKLIKWLRASPQNHLGVYAYDDREVRYEGKLIVGPTGGTYRKTQHMLERFRRDLDFKHTAQAAYDRYQALDGRVDIITLKNPDLKILHTVMVEKNGFIHGLTFGTAHEDKAGKFFEPATYEAWIQPD